MEDCDGKWDVWPNENNNAQMHQRKHTRIGKISYLEMLKRHNHVSQTQTIFKFRQNKKEQTNFVRQTCATDFIHTNFVDSIPTKTKHWKSETQTLKWKTFDDK